jgi:arabinofuranosyltransferase
MSASVLGERVGGAGSRAEPRVGLRLGSWLTWVPVVFVVGVGWSKRWVDEDAFLDFRIVDQIRAGHGPVFNVGQRVEVGTSPLWVAMLTIARSVVWFVHIEYLAVVLGLGLTGLGLWWVQRGAARLWIDPASGVTSPVVPVGAIVIAALPATWEWATSGLENGLSVAWIGALMLVVATIAGRDRRPLPVWKLAGAAAVIGLGPLVRPDLSIMTVVVLAAVVIARRSRGVELVWLLVGCFALPGLYELFRMGYYGILVPNTALAKDAGGAYWSQGWNYLVDLVAPYWLLVPLLTLLAVVAMLSTRGPSRVGGPPLVAVIALPIAGLLHSAYIVRTGGDYLHARLLLPSLLALVAPLAALPWRRWLLAPLTIIGIWALVSITALRPGTHLVILPITDHHVIQGRASMALETKPGRRPVLAEDFRQVDGQLAKRLQAHGEHALVVNTTPQPILDATPGRTTLISTTSGISGFLAGPDVIVHETDSLADPVGSHMPPTAVSGAGHRKNEGYEWMFAMTTRPGITGGFDPTRITAARHALHCGALRALVESTDARLTLDRIWSNLTGAINRTRITIPRDQLAAAHEYCK